MLLQKNVMMAYERSESAQYHFRKFIYKFQPKTKTIVKKLKTILIKLYRQNVSLLFNQSFGNEGQLSKPSPSLSLSLSFSLSLSLSHTHTHTHIYNQLKTLSLENILHYTNGYGMPTVPDIYIYIYIGIIECSPMARETWFQCQVELCQRLKKLYWMPPCLTLSITRYRSRIKWVNPGKGVELFLTTWCSSYRKRSLRFILDYGRQLYFILLY